MREHAASMLAFDTPLEPELEAAMADHLAEVEAIAAAPWPPSFEDTIAALERAGQRLHVAEHMFDDAASTRSNPALRELEVRLRPRLTAHHDAILFDARLFERIADLAARADELGLDAEQAAVLERYNRDAVRAGATLAAPGQARLKAINERLSSLSATFRANLYEETDALAVRVRDAARLDGLPAQLLAAAERDGEGDGWLLKLALPSTQPALEHLHDRGLREELYRAAVARCRRGGAHDNRPVVAEIAALRAERAGLLGFGSHAEYEVADQTARSVQAVRELLTAIGSAASAAAREECARHTAALHADGHTGPLEPWDWPYYDARERRARHGVDDAQLQQFFALDRVIADGLFALAHELYGLTFELRADVERGHPDVRVWAVSDDGGGDRGLLFLDPFARDGKAGGAWQSTYQDPAPLLDRPPHVLMVLNATPPADGAPTLLTPLDVRILFHEFGHALHTLLSDVAYPRIGGTNVPWDVVEFPSTFHEALATRPEVLARYARHVETGAPPGEAELGALAAQEREGAPHTSTQGAAQSLLDQAWHALAPGDAVAAGDVDAFDDAVLAEHGLDLRAVGHRYRSPFFAHAFDGGYAGTHYSYLWSAVLECSALEWLDEQGGASRAAGTRLREGLLARGAAVDPLAALREITGRPPSVQSLLRLRGLA
jgi:peptidyl-dipeptidase Dcp